jgi:hypothetical protein
VPIMYTALRIYTPVSEGPASRRGLLLLPEELGPGMQVLLKEPFLKGWMTSPSLGLSTTLQAPLAGTFSWIRNLPISLSRSCVRFNTINQTLGYVILNNNLTLSMN